MAAAQTWEWEGKVVSALLAATADEAWALLSDFLAFHRWHPRVAKCWRVAGAPCAPGCVRYCEGTPRDDGLPPDWANETLLEYDATRRFFRYEMNDNNMGFGKFFATFRVSPADVSSAEDKSVGHGCKLHWEFECEPVKGTPKEALAARLKAGLDGMAGRVQEVMSMRASITTTAMEATGGGGGGGDGGGHELKLDHSIAV